MIDYVNYLINDQCTVLLNMNYQQIAQVMGVSRPSFYKYKTHPELVNASMIDRLTDHILFTKAMLLTTEATPKESPLKPVKEDI
mgnify:CR=1 FL=1